jgi:hypothetical protein
MSTPHNLPSPRASGCSSHDHHVTCDFDPGCIWIKGKCMEEICSDHKSDVACTLHSSCTWYNNKCYTMQPCKGRVFPWITPDEKGCYLRVFPPNPGDSSLPTEPDSRCLQVLDKSSNGKPVSDSYNPDDCMKDLQKNQANLMTACNMSPVDLERVKNWHCKYLSIPDAEKNAQEQCSSRYSTASDFYHNTSCTMDKDETTRNSKKWVQYTINNPPPGQTNKTWYAYSCKNGPNCTT